MVFYVYEDWNVILKEYFNKTKKTKIIRVVNFSKFKIQPLNIISNPKFSSKLPIIKPFFDDDSWSLDKNTKYFIVPLINILDSMINYQKISIDNNWNFQMF